MSERGIEEASPESGAGDDDLVGQDVPRREDRPLLTGQATFTDDRSVPGLAHLAFVRSEHGHAHLGAVDTAEAESMDGVLGAFTWEDVAASDAPGVIPFAREALDCDVPGHPVLARDRVRYHGQPIAVVVAEDRYRAADAVGTVEVEYDPLDVVTDPAAATGPGAPAVFDDAPDNVALVSELGDADRTDAAFADADHHVELDLVNNRLIPSALEPRGAIGRYDASEDVLTVEMTSQAPHRHRRKIAHTLGVPERKLRVIAPSVGGGFGHKGHHHPGEAMAAWCARRLDTPVKWMATRSENYLAGAHGRDHVTHAELALDDAGNFLGLRARTDAAVGGYGLGHGPVMPGWYGRLLANQYDVDAIFCETRSVFTHTAPISSYRGAGRPEAIYVTERLVNAAARELGFDPVELRRRNLIDPDAFPHETPVGAEYDSGEYAAALDAAVDALAGGSNAKNNDDRLRGVGYAPYVESTGGGFESAVLRVHPDGGVTVYVGTHSHGQGHATTYAQVVADELGIPYGEVSVVEGDTERIPAGTGTFGSRSAITGGNAVAECAREVREKARAIAAGLLDADETDLVRREGGFAVEGDPDRTVGFSSVADAAYGRGRPAGMAPGLEATTFYEPGGTAYTFGTHAVRVAVDPETGEFDVERYVAVDDCGERINPQIVEGQVHGGVAQGIGQARYEEAVYDEDGRLQTDELLRYGVPRAADLPEIETEATVTPSPTNDLGVKGIGEAGTIAAPPAVVNAVLNALEPVGVTDLDMPLSADRVWRAIRDARDGGD